MENTHVIGNLIINIMNDLIFAFGYGILVGLGISTIIHHSISKKKRAQQLIDKWVLEKKHKIELRRAFDSSRIQYKDSDKFLFEDFKEYQYNEKHKLL